ncbi:polysaccharide biosynthesis C-terminal domain-containing protein [Marinilabiliaceae bacterium ANBcel2]|nr:polysaccharide biosynthesis C-terminal domain-containing protein [Marinilabiliaceae bacterium ANBcel2]
MYNQSRFIFRQSFIYAAGNIVTKLSGVLLLPLYLKYISETEFGVVTLLETFFQFILILSGWGAKGGFMRWYHEMGNHEEKRQLFFTTWFFNTGTSLLSLIFCGAIIFIWSSSIFRYPLSTEILLLFLSATLFRLLYDVPFYYLKLEQKAVSQTGWLSLNILMLLGFTFYFLEVKEYGLKGIYLGQFLAHFITLILMIPALITKISFRFKIDVLKEMVRYGIPLAVSNILTTILTLSDRHIINQFQNLDEVAGYSMSFKIANLMQMVVVASIISSYSNYFFKTLNREDNISFFKKFSRIFFIVLLVGGLAIVFFSQEIMYLISAGSPFFQSAVYLVPVLTAGLIFAGMRQVYTLPLNKHKKSRRISLILIIVAVINIGVNILLVPFYGKTGAAWATLIAQLVGFVWFFYESSQLEKSLLQSDKKILWLIPIWIIMLIFWSMLSGGPFFISFAIKLLLFGLFILYLFLIKIVSIKDVKEITNFLRL